MYKDIHVYVFIFFIFFISLTLYKSRSKPKHVLTEDSLKLLRGRDYRRRKDTFKYGGLYGIIGL